MSGQAAFPGRRVLVVPPVSGGSLPVSRHVAEAFRELGATVRYTDLSWLAPPASLAQAAATPRARAELMAYASEIVLNEARHFEPDLCFLLAQAPIAGDAVEALGRLGVTTAFWFVENYRVTTYWRQVAPCYDWFFTVQRGRFHELLRQGGCPRPAWLPLACNPRLHCPRRLSPKLQERYGSDVSFAGYGYFNRRELFRGLTDLDFKIWGPGFASSGVAHLVAGEAQGFDEKTFVRIASAARIHINLHSATHVTGVDPEGDYVNPRLFELAACGAFQISDARADLEAHFRVEEEIPVYRSLGELRAKIERFLHDPEGRRRIAAAARRRAEREHTYVHRMAEVLARTGEARPAARSPVRPKGALDAFPRLAASGLRSRREHQALLSELERSERVSDEEILLRIGGLECGETGGGP